jgi:hypothetical protein
MCSTLSLGSRICVARHAQGILDAVVSKRQSRLSLAGEEPGAGAHACRCMDAPLELDNNREASAATRRRNQPHPTDTGKRT